MPFVVVSNTVLVRPSTFSSPTPEPKRGTSSSRKPSLFVGLSSSFASFRVVESQSPCAAQVGQFSHRGRMVDYSDITRFWGPAGFAERYPKQYKSEIRSRANGDLSNTKLSHCKGSPHQASILFTQILFQPPQYKRKTSRTDLPIISPGCCTITVGQTPYLFGNGGAQGDNGRHRESSQASKNLL